jgi:hypothetical protein
MKKKVIASLGKVVSKFRMIIFSGTLALIAGISILVLGLIYFRNDFITKGAFLTFVGMSIIIVNVKYKKLYRVIEKLKSL